MEIITNHQNLFCIYVSVHAGSIYEKPKQAGMSHVLEHMLLKRTKQYSKTLLIDKLAEIGGISNAMTDKDITSYYIVTTSYNWKKAIDILSSVIKHPEINHHDLELEKQVIVEEINMRKDNYVDCYNLAVETVLPVGNPYCNKVEGTTKLVRDLIKSDLLEYYKERYDKHVIVVNCSPELKNKVKRYLTKRFGVIVIRDVIKPPLLPFHSKIKVEYRDKEQYTHVMSFPSFARKDIKKVCILNFIRFAFINGSFKSKFMNILRTKMGLLYSISSMNDAYMYLGIFGIEMSTTSDKIGDILYVSFKLLKHLKENGLADKELKFFKKAYLSSKEIIFSDEQFRTEWYCNNLFYGSHMSEKDYHNVIESISNNDIILVAKEVFDFAKMGFLTYGRYKHEQKLLYEKLILSYQSRYENPTVV